MLVENKLAITEIGRPLRVVAIGGGTGLANLLQGLKKYVAGPQPAGATKGPTIGDLTAIVTVTDDGGSSGRLRRELNMLPPGDIRNCLVALAEDEQLLSSVLQYRFRSDSALDGHSLGNLFLAALTSITGDFAEAVQRASEILMTRGRIYPATLSHIELEAQLEDGSRVRGETNISRAPGRIARVELVPSDIAPLPEAVEALQHADLITVGPGSLFTSLVPNVLVPGIADAIAQSPAIKVYVCNLMTQVNESLGLSAADHIMALQSHAGGRLFDYVLINNSLPSRELVEKYSAEGSGTLRMDAEELHALDVEIREGPYLLEQGGVARHDSGRLARDLLRLKPRIDKAIQTESAPAVAA